MINNRHLEAGFFAVILIIAVTAVFYVFRPFLGVLVLASTLAVIFYPVYSLILKISRGREGMAAFATVILVLLLVLTPLVFLGYGIFNEATNLYISLAGGGVSNISSFISNLAKGVSDNFNVGIVEINFVDYVKQLASWLVKNVGSIFTGVTEVFVSIFLGLLGFFYLLKDGNKLKKNLVSFLPLSPEHSEAIYSRMGNAVNSVIRGALVVAVIQGAVAGIGLMIFKVPNAILWGTLTSVAALVPTIGTALVIVPASVYLMLQGSLFNGIGLFVWGLLAAGLIDNFISPQLTKKGIGVHPFLILLSVLGGIMVFGPIGFLAGPLILSFLSALLSIYPDLTEKKN